MSAHIFPHSYWPESIIKKIISFFGPVKVYRPWMIDSLDQMNDVSIEISNPPEDLKPDSSFMAMLSEYRQWMKRNRDRSYLEIIKSVRDSRLTDDKTWEIRRMLGRTLQSLTDEEEKITRWHLLLHLAGDLEEQRLAAYKILKELKDKKSPLDGSIEKASDIKNLLGDLQELGTESELNDQNLRKIFEAWFGLFGEYIKENELLITYNRQVMSFLTERRDAPSIADGPANSPTIVFNVPDLSDRTPEGQNRIRMEYNIDDLLKEIKDLIFSMVKNPPGNLTALDNLSKKLNESFPRELSKGALRCTLKYFYPIQDKGLLEKEKVLERFFNQTIILTEEQDALWT